MEESLIEDDDSGIMDVLDKAKVLIDTLNRILPSLAIQ